MRTVGEYRRILALWESGNNKKHIARLTGISRATVRDCINKYGSLAKLEQDTRGKVARGQYDSASVVPQFLSRSPYIHQTYAYILGMYLGDGNISKASGHRTYRLRITLDKKYPGIIQECQSSLDRIMTEQKISIVPRNGQGCIDVSCHYNHWPALFPQHGTGLKHLRPIVLADWQQTIVETYPLDFWRGLYHSDGSRSQNIVKGKNYPRYLFANESDDIRGLFCDACDRLGLRWTIANRRNVCVSRREDVTRLDAIVGPKS